MIKVKYIFIILNTFSKELPKRRWERGLIKQLHITEIFDIPTFIYLNKWEIVTKALMEVLHPI